MKLHKKIASVLLWVLCVCVLFPGVIYAEDVPEMVERVRKGVVQIAGVGSRDAEWYATGSGFGVGIAGEDTNVFVTNRHVVTDNEKICDEIYIMLDNADIQDENTLVRCEVLYTTTGYPDIAIIRATEEVRGIKALPLLPAETARVGSTVYALGYPGATDFGTSHSTIEDITVTNGIISKFMEVEMAGKTKCVLHLAHINHGNSGGPLVTADGAVIGLNTFTIGEDSTYSYAVYVDYVIDALDELGLDYVIYEEEKETEPESTSEQEMISEPEPTSEQEMASEPESTSESSAEQGTNSEPPQDSSEKGSFGVIILAAAIVLATIVLVVCVVMGKRKKRPVSTGYAVLSPDGRKIPIPEGGLTIGRDSSCGIRMASDARGVSRQHCRLTLSNGAVYLTDTGSSYGTFVNRQRLAANSPVMLNRGASFYLAEAVNTFTIL